MFIEVESREEIDALIAVLTIGVCTAIEGGQLTINEAENYLFSPYSVSVLQEVRAGAEAVHVVDAGTWLEDYESLLPDRLFSRLEQIKSYALSILEVLPKSSEPKEKWLKIKAGSVQKGRLKEAMQALLEDLTRIGIEDEELFEEGVSEKMYQAIYNGSLAPVHDHVVPNNYGTAKPGGNRQISKALSHFLNHPEVVAAREQLPTAADRLVVFQDPYIVWEGMSFNTYFRYRAEP